MIAHSLGSDNGTVVMKRCFYFRRYMLGCLEERNVKTSMNVSTETAITANLSIIYLSIYQSICHLYSKWRDKITCCC